MNEVHTSALNELTRLYGVQASYQDAFGKRRRATPEALIAILRALGAPVSAMGDLPQALAARRRELAGRFTEPVAVAWEGRLDLPVRPGAGATGAIECHLELEGGDARHWRLTPETGPGQEADGAPTHVLRLPETLPLGYHRLSVATGGGREARVLVIAAPRTTYGAQVHRRPEWGVFLPLHALHSEESWGVGDLHDLEKLVDWTSGLGGSVVGTLPLFAAFLGPEDDPYEYSPYGPASRLFWNELFLDLSRKGAGDGEGGAGVAAPELEGSAEARKLVSSAAFQKDLASLRKGRMVDYREAMGVKRRVLQALAREHFENGSEARRGQLEKFRREHPELDVYARFRAVGERLGPWQTWAEQGQAAAASGDPAALEGAEPDRDAVRYHLYAQWLTHGRLCSVAERAREAGTGLYLDLPLGAHPSSYDVWRHGALFVPGIGVGAPPDPFFVEGQGWGFPPLHPERQREAGYAYWRAVLQGLFAISGMLRIDHVMGLHRMFWIPDGAPATDGAYVRYPAEEHYAMLCLESHRSRTILVGENLGTVPAYVDQALGRHGIDRMWVAQFALTGEPERAVETPPGDVLACLDTHDTPTFAGFLEGKDLDRRLRDDLLEPERETEERAARETLRKALESHLAEAGLAPRKDPSLAQLARGTLEKLAASPARTLLVNLEDLWGETEQQNEPGTAQERPNWRRRAARSLEELTADREVVDALARIGRGRREARKRHGEAGRRAPAPARRVAAPIVGEDLAGASLLTEDDLYLFNEGSHFRLYEKLGAHPMELDGEPGVYFAVWAPGASSVSVVGDFNGWNGGSHPLAVRGASGIWEGFLPGFEPGELYKFHVVAGASDYRVDKADPFAFHAEEPPRTGSVVWDFRKGGGYSWGDGEWMASRAARNRLEAPISIYELHPGSWMRVPEEGNRPLSYRELAVRLGDHMEAEGFTHVELLPIMEHPFYGSWGYQTTGYFAPTSRYGTPEDFMFFVDHLHQRGIGVILDWVPSHFPSDQHGLSYFDGTHLFEHADPRQGYHPDWNSLIFNYGRHEVRSFLVSSALYWLDRYHIDGIRVDAVASMLYLDYSRKEGEWIPNQYGGRENLEALIFLRQLNEEIYRSFPDVQTFAEESTSWPMVSRPNYLGGLGFGFKWDMGWMHDTLLYMSREPVYRKFHHGELTFRMVYAFSENFCMPLSHDEVVHGKGSLIDKMPGDDWQKFANLRLLYAYMYAQPGKKLLFMGAEIAQRHEWKHDSSLDWHLGQYPSHEGIAKLVGDLNRLYRGEPALHEADCDPAGFEWIEANDAEASALAFLRKGRSTGDLVACVFNFTPVPRQNYRLGVPRTGRWLEVFNSDAEHYWGSGQGNLGGVEAAPIPFHGRSHSVTLTLPPLGAVFLKSEAP